LCIEVLDIFLLLSIVAGLLTLPVAVRCCNWSKKVIVLQRSFCEIITLEYSVFHTCVGVELQVVRSAVGCSHFATTHFRTCVTVVQSVNRCSTLPRQCELCCATALCDHSKGVALFDSSVGYTSLLLLRLVLRHFVEGCAPSSPLSLLFVFLCLTVVTCRVEGFNSHFRCNFHFVFLCAP
jgi:hypothetical protein